MTVRVVSIDGREVKLTATEHALLRLLVQHAGKVLPHQQILREVWGPKHLDRIQYLRAYMARLREKLQAEPSKPSIFLTEPGIGYRLVEIERKPRGG